MKYFLIVILLLPIVAAGQNLNKNVEQYISKNDFSIIKDYFKLLQIPNVASDKTGINKNAAFIKAEFEKRGAEMELWKLADKPHVPPVVYGEINTPGADRTIVLYIHYDGQPADPKNWKHKPWEPKLYSGAMEEGGEEIALTEDGLNPDWRIYARSASDDKAPIIALLTALDFFKENNIKLTSNIKLFLDGEEEAGSPHLQQYLNRYGDRITGDLFLFLDGPVHQSGKPQVVFGVRGSTGMELTVYGPSRSLHSGHYGGWSPVPGQMLAELIATFKDEGGKVMVDGFYDSTAPVTESEREAFKSVPPVEEELKKELGLAWTEFEGQLLMERFLYPTLSVLGLESGNVGELARNVIPSEAIAHLGIRLAKGNDPEKMKDLVEDHIRKQGFYIVRDNPAHETRLKYKKVVKVEREGGYPAVRTPLDLPVSQRIIKAVEKASNEKVVINPTFGGSLPLFYFQEKNDIPIIILPIANHDNNQHAPNENIRIGNIWYGMKAYAQILTME